MKRTRFLTRILSYIVPVAVTLATVSSAAVLHPDVSRVTYHDFGQNYGRYSVQNVNQLLRDLTTTPVDSEQKESIEGIASSGGVYVHYLSDRAHWKLPHEMISYHGVSQTGNVTAINPAFVVTVEHNPTLDPEFTSRDLGSTNKAIHYYSIEHDESNKFELWPGHDYKIMRTSKLITDVDYYAVYTGELTYNSADIPSSTLFYRAGAGSTFQADHEGNIVSISGALTTGGIFYANAGIDKKFINYYPPDWSTIDDDEYPLPMDTRKGDSGSPVFVWNEQSGTYEYISSVWAMQYFPDGTLRQTTAHAVDWTYKTMAGYDVHVDLSAEASQTIRLGAITEEGETVSDQLGYSGTYHMGKITNGDGANIGTMYGIESGLNTWSDLSALKDTDTWYSYTDAYLNDGIDGTKYADLMLTKNLVFTATDSQDYQIYVDANIDLGLGYLDFRKGEQASAQFTIRTDNNSLLNTAGFVVGKDVDLHIQLTNQDANYMREWRKIGEGDMYLEGSGNNQIFLNVGGEGKTYLHQQNGYAAYNVLANNGATVVLADGAGQDAGISQIYRDFTFGAGGATLDMNGNSMDWYTSIAASTAGFTIQALTQDAIITNTNAIYDSVLVYKQSGSQTFQGSFKDTEEGALRIVYAGGGTWTLNSIHTDLSHHAASGFIVESGSVLLTGTQTRHAPGSLASGGRYSHVDDWHYADSKMNVTVKDGGTFQLGSHARLVGHVDVKAGGKYIMNEGVKHQMEYIEGWYEKEDTYKISAYYGHHGNVSLEAGASMEVKYSDGVTANTTYTGNISGAGSVSVDTGIFGATMTFSGDNSQHTGEKTIISGGLILENENAFGDVSENKWLVQEKGFITSGLFTSSHQDNILSYIDENSTGVVALQRKDGDAAFTQLNLNNHKNLIVGAMLGHTVQYGEMGTTESLSAYDGAWNLGGGGGTLVVNYALTGGYELNLGNAYTHGTVRLTNNNNDIGKINFLGAVTLDFDHNDALGGAQLNLNYGVRVFSSSDVSSMLQDTITEEANGVLLLDNIDASTSSIDLTNHSELALGAAGDVTYGGEIKVASGGTYYLGGTTGTLKLTQALAANGQNNLVVDGHGYSGGTIELGAASAITGTVTVQGYHQDTFAELGKNPTGNENITLSFSADDVLKNASHVYVHNGGMIDLNGTSQTVNYLDVAANHRVFDSNLDKESTLTVNLNQGYTLYGTVDVDNLVKNGSGQWSINGHLEYDSFTINEGTVLLNVNDALSSTGIVYVNGGTVKVKQVSNPITDSHVVGTGANFVIRSGGTVNLHTGALVYQSSYSGSVTFEDGGSLTMIGANMSGDMVFYSENDTAGGTIYMGCTKTQGQGSALAEPVAITGDINVVSGTGTINSAKTSNNSHIIDVTGDIAVYHGATLAFKNGGGNTTYNLSASSLNNVVETDSDNNVLEAGTIDVYCNTLALSGTNQTVGGIIHLRGGVTLNGASGTKDINNLTVGDGRSATVSGAATWNIHSLNGSGDTSVLNMNGTGTTVLDDFGNYPGKLTKTNGTLVLSHQQAVSSAQVDMADTSTLAINAEQVNMRVLSGVAGTTVLAGSVAGETSTRSATLVLSGGSDASYAGTVVGDATNALSIVKNGSGDQIFSGALTVQDLTVTEGALSLTATENVNVYGNASIAQGATLNIASGYELDADKTLQVLAGTGTATLGAELTINGGTLDLSGVSLLDTTAVLTVDSVVFGETNDIGIKLGSLSDVDTSLTYTLVSGNWASFDSSAITTLGLQYMDYAYTCAEDGLKIQFSQKEGAVVWAGTNENGTWSEDSFGPNAIQPTSIAIFNDDAENKIVNLTNVPDVDKIYFDNSAGNNYAVQGNGELSHINEISKAGAGEVTLNVPMRGNIAVNLYDGTLILAEKGVAEVASINAYGDATVINGASITTEGLDVDSDYTLDIQGGSLTVNGANVNRAGGTIELNNVALTTAATTVNGTLKFVGDDNSWSVGEHNNVTIAAGATLLLADATALNRTDTGKTIVAGTLGLLAGNEEKNTSASFTSEGQLELQGGAIKVSERADLTINAAVTQSSDASATVTLGNQSSLTLSKGMSLASGTVDMTSSGTTLTVGKESTVGTLKLGATSAVTAPSPDTKLTVGSMRIASNSTTNFDGVYVDVIESLTFANRRLQSGSTVTSNTIGLLNGTVVDDRDANYAITGTLNILGGSEKGGTMYVRGVRLSDGNAQSYLNVGAHAHLIITGEGSGQEGALALSHWGSALRGANKSNFVTVQGTMTSNAILSSHDTHGTVNVLQGGEFNLLKGVVRNTNNTSSNIVVNVSEGATLNALGGTQHAKLLVNLNSGATLGGIATAASGTATFANNFTFGAAGASYELNVNTDVKTYDADTFLLNENSTGGTIALTGSNTYAGNVTMNVSGSGSFNMGTVNVLSDSLIVTGTGTTNIQQLNLTGGAEFSHDKLSLDSGEIIAILPGTSTAVIHASDFVLNGGTLDLSALDVSTTAAMLTIDGTLRSGDNTTTIMLNGDDVRLNEQYVLASGNWSAVQVDKLAALSTEYMSATFEVSAENLKVSFGAADGYVLWNGHGEQDNWNTDEFSDVSMASDVKAVFTDYAVDKVVDVTEAVSAHTLIFDNDADYSLSGEGHVTTNSLELRGTGKVSIDTTMSVNGSISMGNGAILAGSGSVSTQDITFANNGKVVFDGVSLTSSGTANKSMQGKTIQLRGGAKLDMKSHYLTVAGGTLNIEGGDDGTGGVMYINGFRMADVNANGDSSMNIGDHVHVVITGKVLGQKGSFAMSHWPRGTTLNIDGALTSNAIISSWDSTSAVINVKQGGELNLLAGLDRNEERSKPLTVNVKSGATLNAKGGVQRSGFNINLEAGATLGSIAETVAGTATYSNNMNVGTANSSEAVVFNTDVKTVNPDSYMLYDNKGSGGDVVLSGTTTIKGTPTVKVTGAGKLWLASEVKTDSVTPLGISISSKNGKAAASLSGLSTFSRNDATVSISGVDADNMARIDNAMIDIMEGSTLSLSNVVLAHTSHITDAAATLNVSNVVAEVAVGHNATASSMTLAANSSLTSLGDSAEPISLAENANVLHIESSLMDTVSVTGNNLTVKLSGLTADDFVGVDYLSLSFQTEGKEAVSFDANMTITALNTANGSTTAAYYSGIDMTTLYFDASVLAVPEPTTTTLSLLALTALAARRRRRS